MDKNEAIKIIRSNFPTGRIMLCEALETLIPELKENDESIRKWIKKELENKYVEDGVVNNVFADKAFAWLEKQKYIYETTKDKFYLEGFEEGRLYEKRGKTKSISEIVSTEQKHEINDDVLLRFAFYQYDDDTLYLSSVFVEECNRKRGYGRKILKAAEEVAKTFGISKIRLKVESNTWMEEWYKRNGYEYLTSEGKYDWLEKQGEQKPSDKVEPEPYFYCNNGGTIPSCSDCKRNHNNSSFKTEEITIWFTPSFHSKQCIDYIAQQ